MDYVTPQNVLKKMVAVGVAKGRSPAGNLFVKSALGGAILACATTLAIAASEQTGLPIVGAILFPVGFVMILLLGLELVTGSFALVPLATLRRQLSTSEMIRCFGIAIAGHLVGCLGYAALYGMVITNMGASMDADLAVRLRTIAETKTLAYQALGSQGMALVFVKAILCNWMVTLGAVLALSSESTLGKICAMWLPILTFFGQGFEHAVVNLFVIPAGMMLGAEVSVADWWLWNQLPVFIGNFVGGFALTGLGLELAHRVRAATGAQRVAEATGAPSGAGRLTVLRSRS